MAYWGPKLYQNDIAADVRDSVNELLKKGKETNEITNKLLENFGYLSVDFQDERTFWYALADTQWDRGVLLEEVKEKAILLLKDDLLENLSRKENISFSIRRRNDLKELWTKLLSPQPEPNLPKKSRCYKCTWNIGDVFALQIKSDLAKEKGIYGRYFLIQKIDEGHWYPTHTVPIIYVKITKGSELPRDLYEYNSLQYVRTGAVAFANRFWPIDGNNPEKDIAEKNQITYDVDTNGALRKFRLELVITKKKEIPADLIYVGNFYGATPPKGEFIPWDTINISPVFFRKFSDTLESELLEMYSMWPN